MNARHLRLTVRLYDRMAGNLDVGSDSLEPRFAYAPAYLGDPQAIPLSHALPKRPEPYSGVPVRNWFANLLPEGEARLAVAERLKLSDRDDFGLLATIGRDCAGAVTILPELEPPPVAHSTAALRVVSNEQLHEWLHDPPRFLLAENVPARLSLAGAQNKMGVVLTPEGKLAVPAEGNASTWLLKAPNPRFPGMVTLEALVMFIARRVGLPVPTVRVVTSDPICLLVERFDRMVEQENPTQVTRVHQEDFCQALGIPPELKYEAQGGPSLAQGADLIRALGLGGTALRDYVRWSAFNVLVGNADAHGKNISTLRLADGNVQLAPFYDLTATAYYPRTVLSRDLAMRIGSTTDIDNVDDAAWRELAETCRFRPAYVLAEVRRMREWILRVLKPSVEHMARTGADRDVLLRAEELLRARAEGRIPPPDTRTQDAPIRGAWGMSL